MTNGSGDTLQQRQHEIKLLAPPPVHRFNLNKHIRDATLALSPIKSFIDEASPPISPYCNRSRDEQKPKESLAFLHMNSQAGQIIPGVSARQSDKLERRENGFDRNNGNIEIVNENVTSKSYLFTVTLSPL